MQRWRNQICNISLMTQRKFEHLQKREDKILQKMCDEDIREGKRRMENRYMLEAMTVESKRWPKLQDLENSMDTTILLPQTILNNQEYQKKLQRIAFYAEMGDNESM